LTDLRWSEIALFVKKGNILNYEMFLNIRLSPITTCKEISYSYPKEISVPALG